MFKDIDPTIRLLFIGICLAVVALIYVEHMFKGEANCFQVIAGLITAFSSSLFTKMKSSTSPPPGSTTVTSVDQVTKTPSEDKPNV